MYKVLVIEDNDSIRENICEVLNLGGYVVYDAKNGKAGIRLAISNLPDIILCDIMMPELDGYGVLYMLNKNDRTRAIPFIFITAKSDREDIRKGMEMGADDYLTKPFDDIELLKAIESRLNKKEIQHQFYGRTPQTLERIVSNSNGLEELKKIIREHGGRKYKKNQAIHYEGDKVNGIYYIIEGKIKTVKLAEDGRELITCIYGTDDFLDIDAILCNENYNDTAVAMEESILSFLPGDQLDKLLNLYPDIGRKFINMLSNNIHDKEVRLLQIAYYSVRKRIAETIVRLAAKISTDGKTITISRDDLAAITGTAPETISRTLTDFKNENLIEKIGNNLIITNLEKFSKLRN